MKLNFISSIFKQDKKFKRTLFLTVPIFLIFLILSLLQGKISNTSAQIFPVTVSTSHLSFGTVFPGEELEKNFIVSYVDEGNGAEYAIVQQRKPLPSNHSEYPDGGDPEMPGYYRDLCPFLTKISNEQEGDTESSAFVGPDDISDTWTIYFEVPAIFGNVAQDHTGGIISENGEYGCDISINLIESQELEPVCGNEILEEGEECEFDSNCNEGYYCAGCVCIQGGTGGEGSFCGDGHLDFGEECDDGNINSGDGCSSTCLTERSGGGGGGGVAAFCGDGSLDAFRNEECDDGNNIDGDGCSSDCKIEGQVQGASTETGGTGGDGGSEIGPFAQGQGIGDPVAGVFTEEEEKEEEELLIDLNEQEEDSKSLLASVFGVLGSACYECLPWWLVIFFALYSLIKGFTSKKKEKKKYSFIWFLWFIVLLVLIIALYFYWPCVSIWFLITIGLINLLIWFFSTDREKKNLILILGLIILIIFLIVWLLNDCLPLWLLLVLIAFYFIVILVSKTKKEEKLENVIEHN